MTGPRRTTIETVNRLVVLAVAGFMAWFGLKNAMLDLGSYRMPWLIPLTVYTGIVPVAGLLIMLFSVEQIVNGIRDGYEGPEDTELLDRPVV
jgi:TRAP-type C4-dicarboxylate transport system permease small subunit